MRQRLGIAAALLGDPPVLMLDEPVNGLDPEGIRWIRGCCASLAAEGRAVLVSSHLMSELQDTADHLLVVGRGQLVADTRRRRADSARVEVGRVAGPVTRTRRRCGDVLLGRAGATVESPAWRPGVVEVDRPGRRD